MQDLGIEGGQGLGVKGVGCRVWRIKIRGIVSRLHRLAALGFRVQGLGFYRLAILGQQVALVVNHVRRRSVHPARGWLGLGRESDTNLGLFGLGYRV
jgi:hypothetical protein